MMRFRFRTRVAGRLVLVCGMAVGVTGASFAADSARDSVKASGMKPAMLRCEALVEPLGIDTAMPRLSWQLRDTRRGARQTAYEVEVFSKMPGAKAAKADVWDSGRVSSDVSAGVAYGGPTLAAEKRYFWRVTVWDQNGKAYPVSDVSWWETGLLTEENWTAKWIGYESDELHAIRESGARWITNAAEKPEELKANDRRHDFRLRVALKGRVRQAVLYTTGEDATAAWVNGQKVLAAEALTPWKQMPWGTYTRREVTANVRQGSNVVGIEVTRFRVPSSAGAPVRSPMSMCLYVMYVDGATELIKSEPDQWKAALDAGGGWWGESFDDAGWKPAEVYTASKDSFGGDDSGLPWPTGPVAALRKSFKEDKAIVSARLYATAMGAYQFRINGSVVGDEIMAPGWMDFREHVPYQVYDVTKQVRRGENAIAAYLAAGWYSTPLRWFRQGNNYGATEPALKAQLRVEHADGSVEWITTDATWKADASAILSAEIYDGETMDARRVQTGWDTVGFHDAAWHAATIVTPKEPKVIAQYFPPIRAERVMTVKTITNPRPGVYVFDFGQNMSAVPRLKVRGASGEDVRLRFAEVLNPDGTLYVDNLRTAKATDHYILKGTRSGEEYQPTFTFHGFRYAEITGMTGVPTAETLKVVVLHTDAPFTARFSTGDTMVNQIWSNVIWGQRSNFVGTPTDCPQRDERLGWSADAQVFWRTATYDMDLTTFSEKYAADLRGTQVGTAMYGIFAPGTDTPSPGYGAAWSDAGVIVPWTGWVQSGDTRIIDQNWEAMKRYLAEIGEKNPDHLWRNGFGAAFGDWLTPTITTPEDLLATAYWAYDASLMQQMAVATKRTAEAEEYGALFEKIKAAFQKAYVKSDGFVGAADRYPSIPPPTIHPEAEGQSKDRLIETQTGYVLALHMRLVPDAQRAAAAKRLVTKIRENHWLLGTGFLGTPYLLEVLSDTGYSDVAYRLLLNREYPSWGYLVEHGATTTWERWNGDQMRGDPSMNSYNHYAYGAVAEWMYRYAAGVDTVVSSAGFHTILLHPNFDVRLGKLSFDYDSTYGTIHSAWSVTGKRGTWSVTIPPNTTALLRTDGSNAAELRLDGEALAASKRVHATDGGVELPAGSYVFAVTLNEGVELADGGH